MALQNICVYCGSNNGREPVYIEQAQALGRELARRGLGLVYGGAKVGLMGTVADAVLAEGGRVTGILPERLRDKEMAHPGLTELVIVPSMHERKKLMADKADGFIAMPGGAGTLEEILEVWTWAQLGFHQKPCGLFNVAGYYDKLAAFLDHTAQERFMQEAHRAMLMVESDPGVLLDRYATYRAPTVSKWISTVAGK